MPSLISGLLGHTRALFAAPAAARVRTTTLNVTPESLEERLMLTVFIDTDTTWSSDMTLTDNVTVRNGARLTINPGVTVRVDPLFVRSLNFQERTTAGTGGFLTATGVTFEVRVSFNGDDWFANNGGNISGNTFERTVNVHSHEVNHLANNTFLTLPGQTVSGIIVNDDITQNTTWNTPTVTLTDDVDVLNGATLTIASNVVIKQRSSTTNDELFIGSAAQSGFLSASNVTFENRVHFEDSALGGGAPAITGSTFEERVYIHSHDVSQLSGNTFNDILFVSGDVTQNTTWSRDVRILADDVNVSGATLTVSSGVTVESVNVSTFQLIISNSGTLTATNATFALEVIFDSSGSVGANFTGNTFAEPFTIDASRVSDFAGNTFLSGLLVTGAIKADTTWNTDVTLAQTILVNSGATLTVTSGVTVTASTGTELLIGGEGERGFLDASQATFNTDVVFDEEDPSIGLGDINASTFLRDVAVKPMLVNDLDGNTFFGDVLTAGTISSSVQWTVDVTLTGDVFVIDDSILFVAPSVQVFDGGGRLHIGFEDEQALLSAVGASFDADVVFAEENFFPELGENLEANNFLGGVFIAAVNVSQLRGNSLTAVHTEGTLVGNSEWDFDIVLTGDLVIAGAALKIEAGNSVTGGANGSIIVGGVEEGALFARDVSFDVSILFHANSEGELVGNTFGDFDLTWTAGADLTLRENRFIDPAFDLIAAGSSSAVLDATGNQWFFDDLGSIEAQVTHQNDNASLPLVDFSSPIVSGTLGDFVWFDRNGNGIQDANEQGIEGIEVRLITPSNALVQTTFTTADGRYLFTGVAAGDYRLEVIMPETLDVTLDGRGDRFTDSDITISFGTFSRTDTFTYDPSLPDVSIDVGLVSNYQQTPSSVIGLANENWWAGTPDLFGEHNGLLAGQWRGVTLLQSTIGDFNGDGRDDIAAHLSNGDIRVGITAEDGTLTSSRWGGGRTTDVKELHAADFDNDGKDDLIMLFRRGTSNSANWWVYESQGDRFIADFYSRYGDWSGVTDVVVGQFDGVFGEDVAIRNQPGTWWVGRSSSNGDRFTNQAWLNDGAGTVDFAQTGDFDNDGRLDIVAVHDVPGQANKKDVRVYLSQGNAFTNTRWVRLTANTVLNTLVVGDFDGDGDSDIAALLNNQAWWQGTSDGASSFAVSHWGSWTFGADAVDIQVGDSNGDGIDDIFGRHASTGDWWSAESDSSAFNSRMLFSWSSSVNWEHVHVGRFTTLV